MLSKEIESAARLVKTDAYQMSIGELVNMYRDGELIINPDFQRLFRWEIGQKSRLIESLLLGIPLPSIFVFERDDSTWELIDGLQRISTILEFMGELRDPETNENYTQSVLVATKYLPSLSNAVWHRQHNQIEIEGNALNYFTSAQQLSIKRSRLSVEILKRPSDEETKYDLFQRLNSGGIPANPQELRNCIIIMVNRDYSKFLKELADLDVVRTVLALSDEQIEKQKHMEYVSRFMVHTYVPYDGKLDVEEYIDQGIVRLATDCEMRKSGRAFQDTFNILDAAFGEDALRRIQSDGHSGRVGLAAFEGIAVGIAKNIDSIRQKADPIAYVREKIRGFWQSPNSSQFFSPGLRGTVRIQRTVDFGSRWFSE